jgi:hypothetical protein
MSASCMFCWRSASVAFGGAGAVCDGACAGLNDSALKKGRHSKPCSGRARLIAYGPALGSRCRFLRGAITSLVSP